MAFDFGLKGQAAVVTGSTSGIGLALAEALAAQGAVPRIVGPHVGALMDAQGETVQADASLENEPGVLFDAVALPQGAAAVAALAANGLAIEFVKEQYRHGKALLAPADARTLLEQAGVPLQLTDGAPDPGLVLAGGADAAAAETFVQAVARHRHPERETDPPRV